MERHTPTHIAHTRFFCQYCHTLVLPDAGLCRPAHWLTWQGGASAGAFGSQSRTAFEAVMLRM
eukprot:1247610-Amphidinium_carterae.2